MAKVTRYAYSGREGKDGGEEPRRPSARARQSSSPLVPLAILLGMIVGAIVLARAIAGRQQEEQTPAPAAASGPKPFEGYEEAPPAKRSSTSRDGRSYPPAPAGLAASNPDWGRALAIAAEADLLFAEVQRAKQDDAHTLFLEKGLEAKRKYDEAFAMTAVWEERILDQYGDRDPQVREIVRVRTDWSNRMRMLHRTTGR
jgi:hypothetical protein